MSPVEESPVWPADVAVLAEWTLADCSELADHAWQSAAAVVPVRADGASMLIGPVQYRGAPTCLVCAEWARTTVTAGGGSDDALPHAGIIPPTATEVIGELVAASRTSARTADADRIWAVRGSDLTVTTHRALPRHGGCHRCSPVPADSAEGVRPPRATGPSCDPQTLRIPNGRTSVVGLSAVLVDRRFGPVPGTSRSERISVPIAQAALAARAVDGEGGYGRASTFGEAERVALFEVVERFTGMSPGGRQTALVASFAELGPERALDPAALGRHESAAEADPRFALVPYSADARVSWVWGWSMSRGGPVAVPEQAAYWGVPSELGRGLLAESSSGCGLGNSPEEAALFGLFEVIERDAFLMAWFAQTPLRRLAIPESDRFVSALAGRLDSLGYELLLLDATNDLGVPVVVSVALCRDRDSAAPQTFIAAGAHLDRHRAVRAAVVEVAVNIEQLPNVARATPSHYDRHRLRPMLADPGSVFGIEDHVGLNALPEARSRFEPLLSGPPPVPAEDTVDLVSDRTDPALMLAELRTRALRSGVDTIVVDQSDPHTRNRLGLHAARVVAPGAIGLTFGHLYRRTRGVPRLTTVPVKLGRLPAAPEYSSLALHPHPFP